MSRRRVVPPLCQYCVAFPPLDFSSPASAHAELSYTHTLSLSFLTFPFLLPVVKRLATAIPLYLLLHCTFSGSTVDCVLLPTGQRQCPRVLLKLTKLSSIINFKWYRCSCNRTVGAHMTCVQVPHCITSARFQITKRLNGWRPGFRPSLVRLTQPGYCSRPREASG